jgi:hypothetical protein
MTTVPNRARDAALAALRVWPMGQEACPSSGLRWHILKLSSVHSVGAIQTSRPAIKGVSNSLSKANSQFTCFN